MPTIYLVQPAAGSSFWQGFFQSDTGQMGFDRHVDLWALLITECWILRRQEGVFEPPLEDGRKQLQRLRSELRPTALAVHGPDQFLLDAFEELRQFRKLQKRAAVLARHGKPSELSDAPWLTDVVSATVIEQTLVAPVASHASICQIWQHSDRGAWVHIGGPGARNRIDTSAATHGINIRSVARLADVPTW